MPDPTPVVAQFPAYLNYGALGVLTLVLIGVWYARRDDLRVVEKAADKVAESFNGLAEEIKSLVQHEQAREAAAERRHADTRMFVLQKVGEIQQAMMAQMSSTRHQIAGMVQRGHAMVLNALYQSGTIKEQPGPIPVRDEDSQ